MPFVVRIDGYDPVAAAAVTLRAASVDDAGVCHLDGAVWWPVIDRLPMLAMDFFGGVFGAVGTAGSSLSLSVEPWPDFSRYVLDDARVRLWQGDAGAAFAGWTLRFDGRLTSSPAVQDGRAEIAFAVDDRWLDQPLLSTYAGTGGLEGPSELKGSVKPLSLGAPMGVAGVVLDSQKSIIQLHGYGLIESVDVPLERLARQFGSSLGDHANYADLAAATVPAGQWATCRSSGLVRMGAPAYGKLCFLMKGDKAGAGGWVRRAGAIIARIADISGNLAKVSSASLTALDAARPYDLSVHAASQTTARAMIQSVAASVNAVAGVDWLGQLFAIPVQINAAGHTFRADGSALPPVAECRGLANAAPWWRQAIGAQPFWDVHDLSDVALDSASTLLGVATERWPNPPPVEWMRGSIYIDAQNRQYRFEGRALTINGEALTINGDGIDVSGYVDVQDAAVSAAQTMAEAALDSLATITSDGWIAAGEKPALVREHSALIENWLALDAKALALGAAGAERAAAGSAITALNGYLLSLSPPWNETTSDTEVAAVTLRTLFQSAQAAVAALQAAIQGIPGVSPVSIALVPPSFTVLLDASGSAKAGELPKAIAPTATQAGAAVTITTLAIVSGSAVGGSFSIVSGEISMTAISADSGSVDVDVTASGQTLRRRVTFNTARDGADGSVATVLGITSPQINSTSYMALGTVLAVNASSTGKIKLNLTGNYYADTFQGGFKLQYDSGSGWTDVAGSESTGTLAELVTEPTLELKGNVNGAGPYTVTGFSADQPLQVRALGKQLAGSASVTETINLRLYAERVL